MMLFYNLERTGKSYVRGKVFDKILISFNNDLIPILLQSILNLYYITFSPYNIVAYQQSRIL